MRRGAGRRWLTRLFQSRQSLSTAESDARYAQSPWLSDYEKLGLEWRPYLMRLCGPNLRTKTVTTDSIGLRTSYWKDRQVTYEEYRASVEFSVLLGNSAAFGVGASSDRQSISNQLAEITGRQWYNLAGRASNQMQDALTLLLLGASAHNCIVMMTGANDLLFSLYFRQLDRYLPAFWGQEKFTEQFYSNANFAFEEAGTELRYRMTLEGMERSLQIVANNAKATGALLVYALQPLLAWTGKVLHPSEVAVCQQWDAETRGFRTVHHPGRISRWKDRFSADLAGQCARNSVEFVDLNKAVELQGSDHLFVDRIHLTDLGQRRVAEVIAHFLKRAPSQVQKC